MHVVTDADFSWNQAEKETADACWTEREKTHKRCDRIASHVTISSFGDVTLM